MNILQNGWQEALQKNEATNISLANSEYNYKTVFINTF